MSASRLFEGDNMAYTKNTWANGDVITADKLNHLENGVEAADTGGGLTDDIRAALIQLAAKVAYIDDDGAEYYGDLYDALYAVQSIYLNTNSILINTIGGTSQLTATTSPSGATVSWSSSDSSVATVSSSGLVTSVALGSCTITATAGSKTATCSVTVAQKTLSSISAVYTQSGTVYTNTSLNSLKTDLVVTAHWSDNTTSTVSSSDYTLSGTLTVGTSTVTVSYGGETTTFNVTVTAAPTLSSISAVYTQSGTVYDTDSLDSLKADLVVTATYSDTSTATVPSTDYTLSGTLTVGTSTITVSYGGKTTTFNVTVTLNEEWDIEWYYTDGLPENNGFSKSGNGTSNMTASGLELSGTNLMYTPSSENLSSSKIVLETVFVITSLYSSANPSGEGVRRIAYTGSASATIGINSSGVCIYDNTSKSYQSYASVVPNVEYTLRMEAGNDGSRVYLDGSKIYETNVVSTQGSSHTRIVNSNGMQLLKSIKIAYTE